jgi:V/A-type H+/Na+-transporting ATPase subunit A
MTEKPRVAKVASVLDSLITIDTQGLPIRKNEVGYICLGGLFTCEADFSANNMPSSPENLAEKVNKTCLGQQRILSEVLRIRGSSADMQVFEETDGVRVGDNVELTGQMLSVVLGPGLLGQVFDGLENPLHTIAKKQGFFLPRGADIFPLDTDKKWKFTPTVKRGDKLIAGQVVGTVQEGHIQHKIMIPFDEPDSVEILSIQEGNFTLDNPIARILNSRGEEKEIKMYQRWPIRRPIPERMIRRRIAERCYPSEPLTTTVRIIDTFFPIALGGTACIPGPFGAGKTVLQSLIARYSTVDIVIIIACGERAGEVVETIQEYPVMPDPKTGGTLMDRTVIICNTSSMPVAARESSIYTGITIGEYYRQMGCNVLVIADSTSRWAQAMRETSGRMEEIPGEEAFPAYLESSIKNVYERAGVIKTPDGAIGTLTMIGTVSPAGGNFDEPVTQATLATVKDFLGLSSERAYRRFYPAIDPLISWSRYIEQLESWFSKNLDPNWTRHVKMMQEMLIKGDSIYQMMQVTGEEGITIEDYTDWQKSLLIDMVYLQQDAYDPIDISMPRERQVESFNLLKSIVDRTYTFENKEKSRDFFTKITSYYKNLNYSPHNSAEYSDYKSKILKLVQEV